MLDDDGQDGRGTGGVRRAPADDTGQQQRDAVTQLKTRLDESEKAVGTWRWFGGIAAGLASALALAAGSLAIQAAVDHSRIDRLEQLEAARAGRIEQLVETQARQAVTLEQMDRVLTEIRTDVRELRTDQRREAAAERGDRR